MTPDLRGWRLACLGAGLLFVALAALAASGQLLPGEAALRAWVLAVGSGLVPLAGWVNHGGSWHVLLPAMALLLALSREARRAWWLWCAILILTPMIEDLVKPLVARPRPDGPAPGFPSGHATAAATYAWILIHAARRERGLSRQGRRGLVALAAALAVGVGLARVLLRAHWPSDVLGGWALATACVAAGAWWVAGREARALAAGQPDGRRPRAVGAARAAPGDPGPAGG